MVPDFVRCTLGWRKEGRQNHCTMEINTAFELGNSKLIRANVILLLYVAYKYVVFSLGPQKQNSICYIKIIHSPLQRVSKHSLSTYPMQSTLPRYCETYRKE